MRRKKLDRAREREETKMQKRNLCLPPMPKQETVAIVRNKRKKKKIRKRKNNEIISPANPE